MEPAKEHDEEFELQLDDDRKDQAMRAAREEKAAAETFRSLLGKMQEASDLFFGKELMREARKDLGVADAREAGR